MKKALFVFTTIICGSCVKTERHSSNPLEVLPHKLQYAYDHFPSNDTLFTTGIHGNSIGFTFWSRQQNLKWCGIKGAALQEMMLMSVGKVCFIKAFADNFNIYPDVLEQYNLELEVLNTDRSLFAHRKWSLNVIAHH